MESFSFSAIVKGVRFYDGYDSIVEGRRVVCQWDSGNRHDANAVSVYSLLQGRKVMAGHLERDVAAFVGPLLRQNRVTVNG